MNEAGSARKSDYINGRLVSCAGSRKRLKLQPRGYGDAIKAMEVATIPVVCPGNLRAELVLVINDLWAKPSKWAVNLKNPIPDRQVEIVVDMLDLIWKGRPKRPSIWR